MSAHDDAPSGAATSTRFQKGTSGNPKGRPKRDKPPADQQDHRELRVCCSQILREADRVLKLRDGKRTIKLSVFRASLRKLGILAAKGDPKAILTLAHLGLKAEKMRIASRVEQAAHSEPVPRGLVAFYGKHGNSGEA